MTTASEQIPPDLRRRQPLLGVERRVHPPPRSGVRRARRTARRHRRQAALRVRRRPAPPDHPGSRRRARASTARRAVRLLRRHERQGPPRRRARRARIRPSIPSGSTATRGWSAWTNRASKPRGCSRRRVSAWRARCSPTSKHRSTSCGRSTTGSKRTGASATGTGSSACRSSRCPTWTRRSRSWTGALERGARVVSIRNGPAFTPEGTKSPADPMFDPFWARVAEARVVVAPHAGFEDGYVKVSQAIAEEWGRSASFAGDAIDQYSTVISMLMKHRLVHDFAAILVADKLFERHPGVRVAYIENGGTWVGDLLHGLQVLHGQNPGMFQTQPGRPVPRALLGRAVRRGQRPRAREAPSGGADPVRL